MLLHQGVGLGQRLEALYRVAQVGSDVGQHSAIIWDEQSGPSGSVGGDPLAYLGHPRLALALYDQSPPTQDRSRGSPEWKALLGRECDGGLCLPVHGWHIPAKL